MNMDPTKNIKVFNLVTFIILIIVNNLNANGKYDLYNLCTLKYIKY